MAGADRIRSAIDAMLAVPSTKRMALEMACELAELERRARFGSELARLQGYRAGLEEGERRAGAREGVRG